MVTNENNAAETADARSRLINAALRFFAEKGFEAATTREICEAAGANLSAIRYYFGDKAGLYRAVFNRPIGENICHTTISTYAHLSLADALTGFFKQFLDPLKKSEEIRLVMKLYYREMIEPTECLQQEIEAEIKPQHQSLVALLQTHFKLPQTDADLERLAFAIIGMAVYFFVGQEIVSAISPAMLDTPEAIDALAERLAGYALAMITSETQRREEIKA
jgi:AcrR family transcriptional regulator